MQTASHPACFANRPDNGQIQVREFDTVELTCSVNYSGNWAPVMKWQQDGDDVVSNISKVTVAYTSVSYTLSVVAQMGLTGKTFSSTTYFTSANKPSKATTKNVPNYSFTWTSHTVNVQCEYENDAIYWRNI